MKWVNSLDLMRRLRPKHLIPSHTSPIINDEKKIESTLTAYRDAIQYVHDQTVKLMNEGLYPNDIVQRVELPEEMKKSEYLLPFYGTVPWSVRSVFDGYLGWFSGNPADLNPLSSRMFFYFILQSQP